MLIIKLEIEIFYLKTDKKQRITNFCFRGCTFMRIVKFKCEIKQKLENKYLFVQFDEEFEIIKF